MGLILYILIANNFRRKNVLFKAPVTAPLNP